MRRDILGKRLINHKPKNIKVQIENEVVDAMVQIEIEKIKEEVEKVKEEVFEVIEKLEEVIDEPIVDENDERVICINTNVIYENYEVASEEVGVSKSAIKKCINGKTKSAGRGVDGEKLVWKYVKDL